MIKKFLKPFQLVNNIEIWILIVLFGVLYSLYSIVRHLSFDSLIFDLGVYDQIIWLVSRGKPLFSSILESHPWADHFTPTLLLLSPLYWIWDNVVILLLFQAFFVSLGAYPIYLLALKKTKNKLISLTLAFSYLTFFGIQNAIAFDFHPIVLATTLLAYIFWFYEEKKYKAFWLTLILFVGLQENFFLTASALGTYLIIAKKDLRRGIIITACGTLGFFLLIYIVIPSFDNTSFIYLPNHLKNLTIVEKIKLLFYPTTKIQVMISSILAYGFLPVFYPASFIFLFEEFLQRFVGSPIPTRWVVGYHYNAIFAPVLAIAAIEAIRRYFKRRKKLVVFLILGGVFFVQLWVDPALNKLLKPDFYNAMYQKKSNSRKTDVYNEFINLIPKDASVAATNNIGAHLTHRQNLIFLTNCYENTNVWEVDTKRCFKLIPEYIVADLDPKAKENNFYPDTKELLTSYIKHVQESKEYEVIANKEEIYLLKKIAK